MMDGMGFGVMTLMTCLRWFQMFLFLCRHLLDRCFFLLALSSCSQELHNVCWTWLGKSRVANDLLDPPTKRSGCASGGATHRAEGPRRTHSRLGTRAAGTAPRSAEAAGETGAREVVVGPKSWEKKLHLKTCFRLEMHFFWRLWWLPNLVPPKIPLMHFVFKTNPWNFSRKWFHIDCHRFHIAPTVTTLADHHPPAWTAPHQAEQELLLRQQRRRNEREAQKRLLEKAFFASTGERCDIDLVLIVAGPNIFASTHSRLHGMCDNICQH